MEKVRIEAEFEASGAIKKQQEFNKNFTNTEAILKKTAEAQKAYDKAVKSTTDSQKKADTSKPEAQAGKMSSVMTGIFQGLGQSIFGIVSSSFGRAIDSINQNIPAIGQAMEMGKTIMMNNLFRPLAQEIYPIIIKIFQWISENRIVFVKLGTTIVSAFRMVWTVVSSVFNLFKAGFKAIADQIGAGQLTIKKFMDFMNFLMLKISLVFIFLEEALKPVMEAIGTAIGIVLNKFKETFDFIVSFIKDPVKSIEEFDSIIAGLAAGALVLLAIALKVTLTGALHTVTGAFATLTAAMLANPIGLIIAGIVAGTVLLVTAFVAVYKNWDKIKNAFAPVSNMFKKYIIEPVMKFKDIVSSLAGEVIDKAKRSFEDLGNAIKKIFDTNYIGKMIDKMKAGLQGLGRSIKDSLAGTFDSLLNFDFSQIGTAIKRAFTGAFDDIKNTDIGKVFTKLAEKIQGKATGGRITKGQPYIVGEKGQELIVPDSNGFVMNNSDLSSLTKPNPILGKSNTPSAGNYTDSRSFKIEINGGNIEQIKSEVIKIIQDSKPNFRDAFLSTQRTFA